MKKLLLSFVAVGLALTAQAQTKISNSAKCNKPDPQNMIAVGDRPGHAFIIAKQACTWTKSTEIAGSPDKTYESTIFSEASGAKSRDRGYVVDTYASGDKAFVRWQGTATLKDGTPVSQEGTWSFTGGTGKLKGLKGKGTYKCTAEGEGSACDIEGEYELPQ